MPFERLEYGKFCRTTEGPAERMECGELGRSAGFPADVAAMCRPWVLGLGPEAATFAVVGVRTHGTVMRTLETTSGLAHIGYRLGQRPEDGETGRGRPYWLGRYLMASTPTAPDEVFGALEQERLSACVRAEMDVQCRVVGAYRSAARQPDDGDVSFLTDAVVFCVSAVPIRVLGVADEADFFRLATLLWNQLPTSLQALFAVGWNVTPDLGARLSMSVTPAHHSQVAVFDASRKIWTKPRTRWDFKDSQAALAPYHDSDTIPGAMYLREAFDWLPEGSVRFCDHDRAGLADADRPELPPGGDAVRVLGLDVDTVVRTFRRAGYRALDAGRLRDVEAWLAGGHVGRGSLCLSPGDYFFPGSGDALHELALGALANGISRSRADEIIWRALTGPRGRECRDAIAGHSGAGAARARLLEAVADRDTMAVLHCLTIASGVDEAQTLPLAANGELRILLEQNVSACHATALCRLLEGPVVPDACRAWVLRAARMLASLLARHAPREAGTALRALSGISPDGALRMIERWNNGHHPTPADGVLLSNQDDVDMADIAETIRRSWSACAAEALAAAARANPGDARGMVDRLVMWARLLRPAVGGMWSSADLCGAVARGEIPQSGPPEDPSLDLVAAVLRSSSIGWDSERAKRLWCSADAGWVVQFLLDAFPSEDLVPSARQLSQLIPRREWLRRHLLHHSQRRSDFDIASRDFHSIPFDQARDVAWRDEYRSTALWGAFSGVPIPLQGDLEQAITAYSGHDLRRMIVLTHRYLVMNARAMPGAGDRRETVRRVHKALVRPLARANGLSDCDLEQVISHCAGAKPQRWRQMVRMIPLYGDLEVSVVDDPASGPPLRRQGSRISVDQTLGALLAALPKVLSNTIP